MITIIDNLPVETTAMLQALYSRSPKSVSEHLEGMKDASTFMAQYYIGYGHKSIGDCGSTTLFIEGVSMLAAKAIQDWPLYNGQEASTRYMDWGKDKFPAGTERLFDIYNLVFSRMLAVYEQHLSPKAARAAAFDVARGYLPAGCLTNLSWHGNLRQIADHLVGLRCSPLEEVRRVAADITHCLQARYPSSFVVKDRDNSWDLLQEAQCNYSHKPCERAWQTDIKSYPAWINQRPPRAELHHRLRGAGTISFCFPLDYGSWRDLQRHRSCSQNMPLLTLECFEPWYMQQLPVDVRGVVESGLTEYVAGLDNRDSLNAQYMIPMGYRVYSYINCSLPSAIYMAELRSGPSVHPTLRSIAHWMCDVLDGLGIKVHKDTTDDKERRSKQDIVRK